MTASSLRQVTSSSLRRVLTEGVIRVGPDDPLEVAEFVMRTARLRHWPVVQNNWLVGMLALQDFVGRTDGRPKTSRALNAGHIMHEVPVVMRPSDDIETAARLLIHHRLTCVPVVDKGQFVGVVTIDRVVNVALDRLHEEEERRGHTTPISRLMTSTPLVVVQVLDRVDVAISMMRTYGVRHLPVMRGEHLLGIVSDRDIFDVLRASIESPSNILVGEIMTPAPRTVSPDEAAVATGRSLVRHAIGALPVTEHDDLVGIVSKSDFLYYLVSHHQPDWPQTTDCAPTAEGR